MSDDSKITIYIRHETFLQSLLNDITTVIILTGGVAVNEMTLQSAALNFLLGMLGFLAVLGWSASVANSRRIRGATVDEVIQKLRQRLERAA